MPAGIPVATVGVNGAANAGLLAIQMLAIQDADLAAKLSAFKEQMAEGVRAKDAKIQSEVY
jgi:5-(carboxyamino)imidazole ribonucleotide mutase